MKADWAGPEGGRAGLTREGGQDTLLGFLQRSLLCGCAAAQVHIFCGVDGQEVDMGVRNIQAHHREAAAVAIKSLLDGLGDGAGKKKDVAEQCLVEVPEVIHLFFGDNQRVAGHLRVDVEKSEELVVLSNLVGGNFTGHNARKNRRHGIVDNG